MARTWPGPALPIFRCVSVAPCDAGCPFMLCRFITPANPFPMLGVDAVEGGEMERAGRQNHRPPTPLCARVPLPFCSAAIILRDALHVDKLAEGKVLAVELQPDGKHGLGRHAKLGAVALERQVERAVLSTHGRPDAPLRHVLTGAGEGGVEVGNNERRSTRHV